MAQRSGIVVTSHRRWKEAIIDAEWQGTMVSRGSAVDRDSGGQAGHERCSRVTWWTREEPRKEIWSGTTMWVEGLVCIIFFFFFLLIGKRTVYMVLN